MRPAGRGGTLGAMSATTSIALGAAWDRPAPLSVRVLARLRAHGIDRRIARGDDPAASPLLALRAAALVRPAARARLADDLERVLQLAQARAPRRLGAVPVRAYEVAAAASPLRELIALLRGPAPVAPRGVAIARGLIHDGRTPVYARAPRGALARAVRAALAHANPRFHRT
jgi:hypothetical protein